MNAEHPSGARGRVTIAHIKHGARRPVTGACRRMAAVAAALVGVAMVLLPYSAASGQSLTPGPVYRYETQFETYDPPSQFDVVQLILDFALGAWTPEHFHGGPGFITIIDGDVTRRTPGTDQVFHSGETWVEEGVHAAGNASDASPGTAAIFLLPKGARLTTPVPGPAPA